jgi:hypothetical protein
MAWARLKRFSRLIKSTVTPSSDWSRYELQLRRQQKRSRGPRYTKACSRYDQFSDHGARREDRTANLEVEDRISARDPRIVCGIINRGLALYDGKIFRTTLTRACAPTRKPGKNSGNRALRRKRRYSRRWPARRGRRGHYWYFGRGIRHSRLHGWDPGAKSIWRTYHCRSERPQPRVGLATPGGRGGGSTWIAGSLIGTAHSLLGVWATPDHEIPPNIPVTTSTVARFGLTPRPER